MFVFSSKYSGERFILTLICPFISPPMGTCYNLFQEQNISLDIIEMGGVLPTCILVWSNDLKINKNAIQKYITHGLFCEATSKESWALFGSRRG
jgi:hypothetical protein